MQKRGALGAPQSLMSIAPAKIHVEAVELLLGSCTFAIGDNGLAHSFMFGTPNCRIEERRFGTTLYYHFEELDLAAIYVRSNGPRYLRMLPLEDIKSMLRNFLAENFWHARELFFSSTKDTTPLSVKLASHEKSLLSRALAQSAIFSPKNELTLFPLVPVEVSLAHSNDVFALLPATNSSFVDVFDQGQLSQMDMSLFPPEHSFGGTIRKPKSWLGIFAPNGRAATKMRSSVLGALALTQPHHTRYIFSQRHMFGGNCTINAEGISYTLSTRMNTPPVMNDINISSVDSGWLRLLGRKLLSEEKKIERELKALEYFYRAWPQTPEERFPDLCMTLDAVFGDANHATQSFVDGIRSTIGEHIPEKQLRDIVKLRASVIHGGAPDVYESAKYSAYYRKYGSDPIKDIELVAAECLKVRVFDDTLVEHPDPNMKYYDESMSSGRFPRGATSKSILDNRS